MADIGEGVVPSEGTSPVSGDSAAGVPLSFLNAEWINERIANVADRVNMLLDRLIDDGLLGSGYPPFETPLTDEMLMKMSPTEFRNLYDSTPSLQGKAELLARIKDLKLPVRQMLPTAEAIRFPVSPPVAGTQRPPVESSSSNTGTV